MGNSSRGRAALLLPHRHKNYSNQKVELGVYQKLQAVNISSGRKLRIPGYLTMLVSTTNSQAARTKAEESLKKFMLEVVREASAHTTTLIRDADEQSALIMMLSYKSSQENNVCLQARNALLLFSAACWFN